MDNKHRKLFVVKQSEGCRFMPKIHLNTFGGRALPLGEHMRSPLRSPSAAKGRPTSKSGPVFTPDSDGREWLKKVKFSHTRYRALGPELIPVYRQSARR